VRSLAGEWRARLTHRFHAAPSPDKRPQDKGLSTEAKLAVQADFDDSKWQVVQAPLPIEAYGGQWANAEGEAVLRKVIEVPAVL
jgi:hypothetical protein